MGKAKHFADAAQAMKNVVEGYGDAYIVPTYNLLDDLAEEFGFTEAGQKLKAARDYTRFMVKAGRAATCDYVEANRRDTAVRFVVDAVNDKVDSILSRSKSDNHGKLEQEIRDAAALVNLNGASFRNARITDLQAMAAFLKSLDGGKAPAAKSQGSEATTAKLTAAKDLTLGERLYVDNCGACHFVSGEGAAQVFPRLDGASVINADNPAALIHVILAGAQTPSTERAPSVLPMPGFAERMDDAEVAELATFLRKGWSNHAAAVTAAQVQAVRGSMGHAH
ncbi:c-type cytochrome [Pseudomonas sp. Teo4]|uniref:c-type cytochrome n=1 Tax=Pseudomonas sp. Teo4 TaxID=3064528 RepID=UPI002ACB15DF|nr:c-type cytochrome [Pseudomonas sp. Teo4]